ncbi:hypothetical protein FKM82_005237 [Ascaphus truei]
MSLKNDICPLSSTYIMCEVKTPTEYYSILSNLSNSYSLCPQSLCCCKCHRYFHMDLSNLKQIEYGEICDSYSRKIMKICY